MSFGFSIGFGNNFTSRVAEKEQEVNKYQTEVQNFQGDYNNAQNEKSVFDGQKSTADSNVNSTEQQLADAQNSVNDANQALAQAQNIPIETKTNKDGSKTQDSSKRDEAIRNAQTLLATAQAEVDKAIAENTKAKDEAEKIQKQIDDAQKKLDELKGKQDEAQTNLDNAKTDLESAKAEEQKAQEEQAKQAEEKEKAEKNNEDNKDNIFGINKLNPFSLDTNEEISFSNFWGDNKFLSKRLEEKDNVTEDEFKDIAESAKVILNQDSYSDKEVKDVENKLNGITQMSFNLDNEDVKKYSELAKDLKEYSETHKDETANEIKDEVLEIFTEINKNNGVSDATINAVKQSFKEIGVSETKGDNRGEMEKYGGNPGDAWCASFVSWLYGESQGTDNNDTFGYDIAVRYLREDAEKAGYYSTKDYEPVAGDIMIQENNASHTGMVIKTDANYIYTIEGNAGNKVRAKKYSKDGESVNKISGYIRMNDWKGSSNKPINIDYLPDDKYEDADKDLEQSTL